MTDWFVGKVRPYSEAKLAGTLEEMGVEAYAPVIRQKGTRRRDGTREAIERPALQGYLPIRAAHVEASWEWLEQEQDFRDFLRDVTNEIATMPDEQLNPIRAMEQSKPVKFVSGPMFYIGEIVKIPYGSERVPKAFWSRIGQVVSARNGRYCLGGHDFAMEAWFSGSQLLANS